MNLFSPCFEAEQIKVFSRCQVSGADRAVMAGGEVLHRVVRSVGRFGVPVVAELSLVGAASDPVEAHVHVLKLFASNVEQDNAKCSCVVRLHWRRGLFATHLF